MVQYHSKIIFFNFLAIKNKINFEYQYFVVFLSFRFTFYMLHIFFPSFSFAITTNIVPNKMYEIVY